MYSVNLEWLSFNIDLNTVDAWLKANAGSNYSGLSADYDLSVLFSSNPGSVIEKSINDYWNGLTSSSPEATNYQSGSNRKTSDQTLKTANIASAITKLKALGLTDAEISAMLS